MLNFIGTGSAFNTKLGNNSAYIRYENSLYLIDCGSTTYSRMDETNLLDGIDAVTVMITHTHPDHIGSLGDLIFHTYYAMGTIGEANITIVAHPKHNIRGVLHAVGVSEKCYNLILIDPLATGSSGPLVEFKYGDFNLSIIDCIPVNHVDELFCCAYMLKYKDQTIYYSGDCNNIPESVKASLYNNEIDIFYQDTCSADYDNNVHLSFQKLLVLIPYDYRHKVYCMHLDKNFNVSTAIYLGFNVVKSDKELKTVRREYILDPE